MPVALPAAIPDDTVFTLTPFSPSLSLSLRAIFVPMAKKTGTLWEHDQAKARHCHGFGSYVLCLLNDPGQFRSTHTHYQTHVRGRPASDSTVC